MLGEELLGVGGGGGNGMGPGGVGEEDGVGGGGAGEVAGTIATTTIEVSREVEVVQHRDRIIGGRNRHPRKELFV